MPYLYAEQSRETFAEGLRGTAKRPDFLLVVPYLRPLAVDVKIKTAYDGCLIFDVEEVRKLTAFCSSSRRSGYSLHGAQRLPPHEMGAAD